jgi:hypothetical protein
MTLALLALGAPATAAAVDGPITQLAATGGRPDVLARADGSAVAVWEEKPTPATASVHFCRIAAGAGTCTAGSQKVLTSAAGTTTSKPFVFDISAGRLVVVHGGCCPQRTYRWISGDGGATFGNQSDFASIVPFDQGAAAGPGDSISLLGDPAAGTVGYQLASPIGNAKTTQEVVLDTAAGLTFAQTVGIDPADNRPLALWASSSDGFFSSSAAGSLNQAASWTTPPGKLADTTGMRLAGPLAVWTRAGRHEVARWAGSAFSAGVTLPGEPAEAGEADIARDASGGVHVVYTPGTTGNLCYAYSQDGSAFTVSRLLGRDTGGVSGLQVSATGPGEGRVVFGAAGSGGPVSIVSLSAPPLQPNACATPPAGLTLVKTLTGNVLRAAVDPAGQNATFHVDYGTTTAYGARTAEIAVPAAAGPVVKNVDLGRLALSTTYHARLVATNPSGTATSADLVFRTAGRLTPVRARDLVRLPTRCRHRRARISFRTHKGVRLVQAVLRGTGRHRPLRLRGRRLQGSATLSGLARTRVTVRVALRLADGRILQTNRLYTRCAG